MMAGTALDKLKELLNAQSEGLQLEAVRSVYELLIGMTTTGDSFATEASLRCLEALPARRSVPKRRRSAI